jgi:TonB family protein
MRQARISLITLCLVLLVALPVVAQEKSASTPSTGTESERPKSQIELILEDAKKRGETIISACLQDCDESANNIDGFEAGRALELPKPVYPPIAAAAHASGEVQVQIIIDLDGNVIAAASISGHPLLQAAAVNAARGARFAPSKLNGTPVKVVGVITYNFVAL